MSPKKIDSLEQKYKERIKKEIEGKYEEFNSQEYKQFVNDYQDIPRTKYEKICAWCGKNIGIKPDKKKSDDILEVCDLARLQLTPEGVYSFAIMFPLILIVVFGFPSLLLGQGGFFLFFLVLLGSLGIVPQLLKMPFFLADNFRLKASNQMVLSVFYLVTYMRHTSNIERAVQFAGAYLEDPLAFEFKKILWDVESGQFENVTDSIENFLQKWRKTNPEFVDAIHLVEGSLLEGSEQRRLDILDKSLDVILDETYEKMLHFAHNLQSPITTLHMLGIILPILGLVILPLMLSFMDDVKWYHISVLYNVFLPISVYLLGLKILAKRPSSCGDSSIDKTNTEIQKALKATVKIFKFDTKMSPKSFSITIGLIFLLIGFSPFLFHMFNISDFGFGEDTEISSCGKQYCFLDYHESDTELNNDGTAKIVGPFGLGATLISLFVILALGISVGTYFKSKTIELKKIYDKSHSLENEFSSALFQLGNKLGDNIPAEVATVKVAESLPDTPSGNFFKIVAINIQKLGLSIEDAIFDNHIGAMIYYPSNLIKSSMKVLIQAVKKGPLIASNALINISRYVKEMHNVEERLKDLMAEVISSMKSQIKFLTPIIAAIVVGITSMISTIMLNLSASMNGLGDSMQGDAASQMGMITSFFHASLPTYYFQVIVGLYVVQITFILSRLINTIENGPDKIQGDYSLGINLVKSTKIYVVTTFIVVLSFNIVASSIMPSF